MRSSKSDSVRGAVFVACMALIGGCSDEEIQLQKAKPVEIGTLKEEKASKSQSSLKRGTPPIGSSSGMTHNPSETPRP